MGSRLGTVVAAAAVVGLAAAVTCWVVLPHALDPAPLAAALLLGGALVLVGAPALLLAALRLRPGVPALVLVAVVPVAAAAAAVGLLAPPALAAGARGAALALAGGLVAATAVAALGLGRVAARAPVLAAVSALGVVTLGNAVAARLAQGAVPSVRVLLVGLDGTTWKVMKPLRRTGRVPTIARLMREGAAGTLESEEPTVSPRVWTTIATGKGPERHRIMDFETPQHALRAARIWEILEGQGMTVGVHGYLVTWPPGRHRGFLVPGWEAGGPEASPPELSFVRYTPGSAAEAAAMGIAYLAHGARVGSLADATAAVVRYRGWTAAGYSAAAAFAQLALETDVFLHALRRHRPEFATLVVSGSDTVSHLYWRHMDARHFPDVAPQERARFRDVIPRYYRAADRALARLLAAVPADAHVVVLSDHGNGPLLAARRTLSVRAAELLDALGMRQDGVSVTTISGAAHFEAPSGAVRDELRRRLADVRWAGSAAPALAVDVTAGRVVRARALVPEGAERALRVAGRTVAADELLHDKSFSGDHTRQGILVVRGPRVPPGTRIRGARIRDVTPTLLALFDLPVADDMDGRVLDALFARPPSPGRVASWDHHLPRFEAATDGVGDDVQERLKALGYL
jgi:hypothetical protein